MENAELVKKLREIAAGLEAIKVPEDTDEFAMQKLDQVKAKLAEFKSQLDAMPAAFRKEYEDFTTFLVESTESPLKQLIYQWKARAKEKGLPEQLFTLLILTSISALQTAIRHSVMWLNHLANTIEAEAQIKSIEEQK